MRTRSLQTLGSLSLHTRCVDETPVTPALRASDAEREAVARTLRAHLAAGRLTVDEFSERVERTFARPASTSCRHSSQICRLRALCRSGGAAAARRLWPGNLPFKTRIRSSQSVESVRDSAMRTVVPELIADGYRLRSQAPTTLVLERTHRPAWTFFLAVIVFPLGLIALLHTDSSQVVIHLEPAGNGTLAQVQRHRAPSRPACRPRARNVMRGTLKCARHDSNMRPLPPQGSALSPELRALGAPSVPRRRARLGVAPERLHTSERSRARGRGSASTSLRNTRADLSPCRTSARSCRRVRGLTGSVAARLDAAEGVVVVGRSPSRTDSRVPLGPHDCPWPDVSSEWTNRSCDARRSSTGSRTGATRVPGSRCRGSCRRARGRRSRRAGSSCCAGRRRCRFPSPRGYTPSCARSCRSSRASSSSARAVVVEVRAPRQAPSQARARGP